MNVIWLTGRSNTELGFLVAGTSKRPMLPGTIDRTLQIAGRNGAWDYGADVGSRVFNYDCVFIKKDHLQLEQAAIRLAGYLVDSYGKPRTHELVLASRPDQSITVRYTGSLDIDRIMGFGKFTLTLTAFDPLFKSGERLLETNLSQSPSSIHIESSGTIRTEPYIVLTNQGANTINRIRLVNETRIE